MSAAAADADVRTVFYQVLGARTKDVDETILDYVVNVLKDDEFEFGWNGEGAYDAVGDLLVDSGCVQDEAAARKLCGTMADRFGQRNANSQSQGGFRKLATSVRMSDGMPETENLSHVEPTQAPPQISERDHAKLERRRRKDERQRLQEYEAHVAAAEAAVAGMPAVMVNHGGVGEGSVPKDIRLDNFSISLGGKELINQATVTLAYGRRYGLVGRNGTGKTTFLKNLAAHQIEGTPKNCQILHVEQEVAGDDVTVIQCVLSSDVERTQLLEEEARLMEQKDPLSRTSSSNGAPPEVHENGKVPSRGRKITGDPRAAKSEQMPQTEAAKEDRKDVVSERLAQIYKRLEQIDAYSAESRAASILAGQFSILEECIYCAVGCFNAFWYQPFIKALEEVKKEDRGKEGFLWATATVVPGQVPAEQGT